MEKEREITEKVIDKYFTANPNFLVQHHLDSYNDFFSNGIYDIFKQNNPFRFSERQLDDKTPPNEILLYMGGKEGRKLYFGKPIIFDASHTHYMYPNDCRLRNMTYGTTIHYDIEVEIVTYDAEGKRNMQEFKIEQVYLGKFPIMLNSNLCILNSLERHVRFNMGECKNDSGGYFIINGKEKVIMPQEVFSKNMLYVRKNAVDDKYAFSAEVRSISEDPSKPIRTTAVKLVAKYKNISVLVPNVRNPVPLFILMRALGIISDKAIIECCLLDLKKKSHMIDLFTPSIHDAGRIFTQEMAINYIRLLTKRQTVTGTLDILMNFFLPHIGEDNYYEKAYYVGYMVNKLLAVYTNEEKPTDRDSFKFKRIQLTGDLIYDLFREYYLIQKRAIERKIDEQYYYHKGLYEDGKIADLIETNYTMYFKDRVVEEGFRKAFKGNWGSQANTKKIGVIQDLNRLSWNSFISHLRKIILPLDSTAKVVGPRLLHSSQWGYIDFFDSPDGSNIGLHKHLSLSANVSNFVSYRVIEKWLMDNFTISTLYDSTAEMIAGNTKIFVNGKWIGMLNDDAMFLLEVFKIHRRNGLIPLFTSISFDIRNNEINIFSDSGRLMRPIYYIDENKQLSIKRFTDSATWENMIIGFNKKKEGVMYNKNYLYNAEDIYIKPDLNKKAILEFIDSSEEETQLIAIKMDELTKNRFYTHLEIDPSLFLGVMGNLIIFPENNQLPRNVFSCGQGKQAVSLYNSNYQLRMDKMGVVLNNGQVPLIKSRFLKYINNEEMPYGVNAVVAIMCYTGYNVEDAILINGASVDRGMFRTSYYTMYEAHEEMSKRTGTDEYFANVQKKNATGIKVGFDYGYLDDWGLVKEGTEINDKIVVIGKVTANGESIKDSSVFTKKGQLGVVDKTFITEGEEGTRIAKVRIREERIPALGDKMCSRAGQKGTIGLIIPEADMPYMEDGIRPDLIINPHAIPSRMTIGQLIESLLGIVCSHYGGFGDCTSFKSNGPNLDTYGELLVNAGYHSSGNNVLYNGMTGQQLSADIFIGPTYYTRLKHMVKDKINYRALGPRTMLTRLPVQGRANDGGLAIGAMERDGIMAHGASAFLNESFMERADEYYMAVCNQTGNIAVYNESQNLFMSPSADGPIKYTTTIDNNLVVNNVTRFGRSFSIVRIPYNLKLILQELQVMNVQMRIITDANVNNLMNMSYSENIHTLMNVSEKEPLDKVFERYITDIKERRKPKHTKSYFAQQQKKAHDDKESISEEELNEEDLLEYAPHSPAYVPPSSEDSPAYAPHSPAYAPSDSGDQPLFTPHTPDYEPDLWEVVEAPVYNATTPNYIPTTPSISPPSVVKQSINGGNSDATQPPVDEQTQDVQNAGGNSNGGFIKKNDRFDGEIADVLKVQEKGGDDNKDNSSEEGGGGESKVIKIG